MQIFIICHLCQDGIIVVSIGLQMIAMCAEIRPGTTWQLAIAGLHGEGLLLWEYPGSKQSGELSFCKSAMGCENAELVLNPNQKPFLPAKEAQNAKPPHVTTTHL